MGNHEKMLHCRGKAFRDEGNRLIGPNQTELDLANKVCIDYQKPGCIHKGQNVVQNRTEVMNTD